MTEKTDTPESTTAPDSQTTPEQIDDLFNSLHGLACQAGEGNETAECALTAIDVLVCAYDSRTQALEARIDELEARVDETESRMWGN